MNIYYYFYKRSNTEMKSKCKTCGKNCDGEYCFIHKPKKPIKSRRNHSLSSKTVDSVGEVIQPIDKTKELSKVVKNTSFNRKISDMNVFFLQIWNDRKKHECENCGEWLGKEPLSYMFDHLLEKSKYPELKFDEDNIMLVCLKCHDEKTRGFASEYVNNRIKIVKQKHEGT